MKNSKQNRNFGICCSLSAGILWGIVPVYIKFIDADDPYEIVAHRSLWSAVLLFIICWNAGQLGGIWDMIKQPRNFLNFFITTFFLSLNWGVYVYAVQTGQVVSAALGYFIYPLCTVFLGILVLGERLDKWAWLAVGVGMSRRLGKGDDDYGCALDFFGAGRHLFALCRYSQTDGY